VIPWLFFAVVFAVAFLFTWISLSILRRLEAFNFLKTFGLTASISIATGVCAIWLCWPTLNDYNDVTAVAKPGANISLVTKRFGEPTEHYVLPDGTQSYLYAEGMMTGYTSIDTDANGIILGVGYVD